MRNAGTVIQPNRACLLSAALAVAPLLLTASAHAETAAVGLAAVGVDVRAALRSDLDVRDALNRPVSRRAVERDLSAAAAGTNHGAKLSRLPRALELWRLLDRVLTGFELRGGLPDANSPAQAGLPWFPKPPAILAIVLLASALLAPRPLSLRAALAAPSCHPGRPLVLRC